MLAATGSMSGLRLLGAKKLNDFAKLLALFDGDLYIVDGDVVDRSSPRPLSSVLLCPVRLAMVSIIAVDERQSKVKRRSSGKIVVPIHNFSIYITEKCENIVNSSPCYFGKIFIDIRTVDL